LQTKNLGFMEFVSKEQKLKEWHRRADEGRIEALKREKSLTCIASLAVLIFVLLVICVMWLFIEGILWFIQCL